MWYSIVVSEPHEAEGNFSRVPKEQTSHCVERMYPLMHKQTTKGTGNSQTVNALILTYTNTYIYMKICVYIYVYQQTLYSRTYTTHNQSDTQLTKQGPNKHTDVLTTVTRQRYESNPIQRINLTTM